MAISPAGVLQRYNNCLDESKRVLGKLGHKLHRPALRIDSHTNQERVEVTLAEPLYFENWPYRVSSRENIDIVVDICETIRKSDAACIKSAVTVNYFLRDGSEVYACDAIKYDYSEDADPQHPICHAQNLNRIINPLPESFDTGTTILQEALSKRQQAARIPTAFVNLAGLLAKVTADHLSNGAYAEFWAACEGVVQNIPCHSRQGGMPRIVESGCVRSRYWYPR